MSNKYLRPLSRLSLLASAASVLMLAAACGGSSSAGPASSGGATSQANAKTAAVSVKDTGAGKILVDGQGRTMYAFAADSKGHSNCNGSCLTYWPAVKTGAKAPTPANGVTATFGVLRRSDGATQLTVDGWPMYTYIGDSKPGATTGQGKDLDGGLWWVVDPSGKWITKDSAAGNGTKSPVSRDGSGY